MGRKSGKVGNRETGKLEKGNAERRKNEKAGWKRRGGVFRFLAFRFPNF